MKLSCSLILALTLLGALEETQAQLPGYSVTVSPTNIVVGEAIMVRWTVPPGTFTLDDWVGLFAVTSADDQYVTWKDNLLRGGETTFSAPEIPGLYNIRYFEIFETDSFHSHLAAVSATLTVRPLLTIGKKGAELQLAWQENTMQFKLLSATNLMTAFTLVTNTITRTNGIAYVSLPIPTAQVEGYFKLY